MTKSNNDDRYDEAPLKSISTEPIVLRDYKGHRDHRVAVYTQEQLLEDHRREAERLRARQATTATFQGFHFQKLPANGWGSIFAHQAHMRRCKICAVLSPRKRTSAQPVGIPFLLE
jgi:hypothetical protein